MSAKITKKLKMIDSHIHLWDLSLGKNAWLLEPEDGSFLGDYSALEKNYLISDYLRDSENFAVEKIVYIQAGWDRTDVTGEALWLNKINNGLLGAIIPYANLMSEQAEQHLAQLAAIPLVKGIRQIAAWREDKYYRCCERNLLENEFWMKNFALLSKHNLSFDLQIYPEQADQAYELIKRNPNIPVAIEHVMQPTAFNRDALRLWESKIAKLALLPNAFIKLSGFNLFSHNFNYDTVKYLIETCIHHFSPDHCMFGSNYPVERLFISFDVLFEMLMKITAQYSPAEQAALFYKTAKRFYQI